MSSFLEGHSTVDTMCVSIVIADIKVVPPYAAAGAVLVREAIGVKTTIIKQ
jgi:hypothetical protein